MRELDADGRRRLRSVLSTHAPWLLDPEVGPTTVDAGQCHRCGERPRVVATCGPAVARTLCAACVLEVGDEGWCDGHRDVAAHAQAWATAAPPWWADAVVLWWVATGEVRADPDVVDARGLLPAAVRGALPPPHPQHGR